MGFTFHNKKRYLNYFCLVEVGQKWGGVWGWGDGQAGLWPRGVPTLLCGIRASLSACGSPSPVRSDTETQRAAETAGKAGAEGTGGWAAGGQPASATPADLSLVVPPGEPQSRSSKSASNLTAVSHCCHHPPVPCPGLSPPPLSR